jgi:histidine triad (HIT) family protein
MSQESSHNHSENCIFCKIIAGQIPSKKVYEDAEMYAFHDINPGAPVHFLIVPKRHFSNLMVTTSADDELLGRMLTIAPRLAQEQGCRPGDSGGFRVVINNGADGGQEVYHLHMHVMGGPRPWNKN